MLRACNYSAVLYRGAYSIWRTRFGCCYRDRCVNQFSDGASVRFRLSGFHFGMVLTVLLAG
jgi:hypothetical protein